MDKCMYINITCGSYVIGPVCVWSVLLSNAVMKEPICVVLGTVGWDPTPNRITYKHLNMQMYKIFKELRVLCWIHINKSLNMVFNQSKLRPTNETKYPAVIHQKITAVFPWVFTPVLTGQFCKTFTAQFSKIFIARVCDEITARICCERSPNDTRRFDVGPKWVRMCTCK